ncbi:MAG: P-loop NTPase, partial [Acidobacteria bacterium]|nr:P-loop NTPase [Acidobacteriota bacterium]
VPFLGAIPLDPAIAEGGDAGRPIVVLDPDGPHAQAFARVAQSVLEALASTASE